MAYQHDSDPRNWDAARRATHLAEVGLPLLPAVAGEVSRYRGVLIHWTSTLDTRITLVIDELPELQRDRLHSAFAHKGSCSFAWVGEPPAQLRTGDYLDVMEDGEGVDTWVVNNSYRIDAPAREAASDLRSMPYAEYLQSEHWQALRTQAIAHYGDTCVLCDRKPVQVHHRTYARRGAERLTDLIVLCDDCHDSYHARAS
jgi:hypothetical protein